MKVQDLIFFLVYIGLIVSRKRIWFVWAGLICLMLAIPLFSFWIFFTAERLTWYAAAFFLAYVISLVWPHKVQ